MQKLSFSAMGCHMLAAIATDSMRGQRLLRQVPRWFATWEDSLSRFRPESELSRLNRASGEPTQVSQTFWRVFRAAELAARESDGLIVPTVLPALEAAGYDRTFETLGGDRAGATTAVAVEPLAAVEADPEARTIRLQNGVRLDFGGVAKGWAADIAARRLARHAPALVDAGGDIAVAGSPDRVYPWPVGVADPLNPDRQLVLLRLSCGGVATSGRDYRRWQRDGKWLHHIIDPRTGQPSETDVVSATVIGPSTRKAEAAAKVAFILGSEKGIAWLDARPSLAGLLVRENGEVVSSKRLGQFLW